MLQILKQDSLLDIVNIIKDLVDNYGIGNLGVIVLMIITLATFYLLYRFITDMITQNKTFYENVTGAFIEEVKEMRQESRLERKEILNVLSNLRITLAEICGKIDVKSDKV